MEREKIIVLHARGYNFKKEGTEDYISGIKMKYIMADSLEPIKAEDGSEKGYLIAENSIALENAHKLASVPGIYYATYGKTVNAKGQVIQKLTGVEFIKSLVETQQEIKK